LQASKKHLARKGNGKQGSEQAKSECKQPGSKKGGKNAKKRRFARPFKR
jgi:hypothetical protein